MRRAALAGCTLLLPALLFLPRPGAAADLVVEGCNEQLAGEVGVAELVGNVGQQIAVPVTVHATSTIEAFVLNVDVPPGVLSYVRTDRGSLTGAFQQLGGNYFAATSQVRIVGLDNGGGIPNGAVGSLAVLVFQVTAAGSGAFGTSNLQDDLSTYQPCEQVHGTSPVTVSTWGRAKAAYR